MKLTTKLSLIDQLEKRIAILSKDDLALYEDLVKTAQEVTGSDRGSFFLFNSETSQLETTVAQGLEAKIYVSLNEGIVGACAYSRSLIVENDVDATKKFNADVDLGSGYVTRNTLSIPIIKDGNLLGVIQLLNKVLGDYDEKDEHLLKKIAAIASDHM